MNSKFLSVEMTGSIAVVTMQRADKRNAINEALLNALNDFFSAPPADCRVVVLQGDGAHFCSGLDLAERLNRPNRDAFERVRNSRKWHNVFEKIEHGEIPVISVLKGGVIGGGLELAASTHIRVAQEDTFFQLPEGQHGIFVGGGGSVRIPRIIGAGQVVEMMLTARKMDVLEGRQLGLVHYQAPTGAATELAMSLAHKVARNAFLSNYAIVNAISRIQDMGSADGLFAESMVASLAASSREGDERIAGFFDRLSARKEVPATSPIPPPPNA